MFMKIVLAEKCHRHAGGVEREPGWEIVTADQIAKLGPGGLEKELAEADALVVRSACRWMPSCWKPRQSCE